MAATRYWLNTTGDGDDTNPANYDVAPRSGDDLVFDSSQPGYAGPSGGDGSNGGLNGYTFGTVSVMDGSFIGGNGAWSAGPLYLYNNSTAAITCATVNAGSDNSSCNFNGTATNAGSVFAGTSNNNGSLQQYSSFYAYSSNDGATGDDTVYNDNTDDFGRDGDRIIYNDNAQCIGALINIGDGAATFNDSASCYGIDCTVLNWYSSGTMSDMYYAVAIATANVYADLRPYLFYNSSFIGGAVIKNTTAYLYADQLGNGCTIGGITVDTTNLTADNIKSGVPILGVTGTLASGGASESPGGVPANF